LRERERENTNHDGDEMPIIIGERSIAPQDKVLGSQEYIQI
jgi:hypothetical protein